MKCNQCNKPKRRFPCLIKQISISTPGFSLFYWRCYVFVLCSISSSSEQFIFPSSCLYKPGLRSGLWLEIRFGFEARLCHRLRCRFRRLLRLGFNSQKFVQVIFNSVEKMRYKRLKIDAIDWGMDAEVQTQLGERKIYWKHEECRYHQLILGW